VDVDVDVDVDGDGDSVDDDDGNGNDAGGGRVCLTLSVLRMCCDGGRRWDGGIGGQL